MFKCKIKMEELDKNNQKALEITKAKNLSKAAVKKLAEKEEEKTPFYIIKNYFKKGGIPIADFIAFGVDKKMHVQFSKKEVKGKGMADSKKDAAFGKAFVKSVNGKRIIHFEPDPSCKIPKGIWPKLLKSLKQMLGGMKATVLFGGNELIDDDEEKENPENKNIQESETEVGEESVVDDFPVEKKSLKEILRGKKMTASNTVNDVNSIKNIYDRDKKEEIYKNSVEWLNNYNNLDEQQQKLVAKEAAAMQKINKLITSKILKDNKVSEALKYIHKLLDQYLDSSGSEEISEKISGKIIKRIDNIKPEIQSLNDIDLLHECEEIKALLN